MASSGRRTAPRPALAGHAVGRARAARPPRRSSQDPPRVQINSGVPSIRAPKRSRVPDSPSHGPAGSGPASWSSRSASHGGVRSSASSTSWAPSATRHDGRPRPDLEAEQAMVLVPDQQGRRAAPPAHAPPPPRGTASVSGQAPGQPQ